MSVLGRHAGFLVGALSALLSNVFFVGSWTPWQIAWGLVGYLGGLLATWVRSAALQGTRRNPQTSTFSSYGLGVSGLVMNVYFVIGLSSSNPRSPPFSRLQLLFLDLTRMGNNAYFS